MLKESVMTIIGIFTLFSKVFKLNDNSQLKLIIERMTIANGLLSNNNARVFIFNRMLSANGIPRSHGLKLTQNYSTLK